MGKICIISPSTLEVNSKRGGGCEISDYNIARKLSLNNEVFIISTYYGPRYRLIKEYDENLEIWQVPLQAPSEYPIVGSIAAMMQMLSLLIFSFFGSFIVLYLRFKGLDTIVVHNLPSSFFSLLIAKSTGIRILYSEGNLTPWIDPYLGRKPKQTIFQKLYAVVSIKSLIFLSETAYRIRVQSQIIADSMIFNGIIPNKIFIIGPSLDERSISEAYELPRLIHDPLKVCFIGRLQEIKGVSILEDVISLAEKECLNVEFYIFGKGPYEERLKAHTNVKRVEFIKHDILMSILGDFDIYLSFQKSMGRAEVEAMASGCILIGTMSGDMNSYIEDGVNGFLTDPYALSYILILKKIISTKNGTKSIQIKSKEYALKNFGSIPISEKWHHFINP